MANYLKAGNVSEFKDGDKKMVTLEGHDIMLARVGNNYYAIANKCPHLGGNLSKGILEGKTITCPLHGSQYDITNGKVIRWMKGSGLAYTLGKAVKPPQAVKTFPVKIAGEDITIEV
jgi:3-phenylpropionate/trans-cinnamate dioxygenase ferredoxin subunit